MRYKAPSKNYAHGLQCVVSILVNSLRPSDAYMPDNGLPPGRRQAIIWTGDVILLIQTLCDQFQWNLKRNVYALIRLNTLENDFCEKAAI